MSAAYHLAEPYEIIERADVIGGAAGSVTINGYTFDHAIHILYTKDAYAGALIRKLLEGNYSTRNRSSWIFSCNTFTRYPYQANMFGLPADVISKNIEGLRLAARDRDRSAASNFYEWIIETFGEGIAKNFMIPFNEKVWATDLRSMSHDWVSSRVPMPDLEDVIAGATTDDQHQYGDNGEFWYPRHGGIGALADAFASELSTPIQLGLSAVLIDPENRSLTLSDGSTRSYNNIISTLPLPALIRMIKNVPEYIRAAAESLRSNRVRTLMLGVDRSHISDKHWIYFPERQYPFQRVSFPMNLAEAVVPEGKSAVLVELSEPHDQVQPDEQELLRAVVAGLCDAGILRESDVLEVTKWLVIDPAYVIYDHSHKGTCATLAAYLEDLQIFSCGRFGEWEYYNMDHSILSGKRAAEKCVSLMFATHD